MAVQACAYGAEFLESPEVLGSKLQAFGGTCWGAFAVGAGPAADAAAAPGDSQHLCAYAIAHALAPGTPLAWNKPLATHAAPAPGDWFYVHDIAIHPEWAGAGLAARLLTKVLDAGRRLALSRAMLVAVQGADAYWARHGFVAQPPPMPVQGFGDGAVWMTRVL
jgi:GNAT superfamily N-acetyltransferase